MTGSANKDPQNAVPPGSGYIPPDSSLASTGLSAGFSGTTAFAGVALMTLAWNVGPVGGTTRAVAESGTLQNVPFAAALMLAAIAFAGLALLGTALTGREYGYELETPLSLLRAYVVLGLLGLVADALGLDFLALGALSSFRLAAIAGTVLQILALAAGVYGRLPQEARRKVVRRAENPAAQVDVKSSTVEPDRSLA